MKRIWNWHFNQNIDVQYSTLYVGKQECAQLPQTQALAQTFNSTKLLFIIMFHHSRSYAFLQDSVSILGTGCSSLFFYALYFKFWTTLV